MYVKRFKGPTLADALGRARREMGEDTLLLGTRADEDTGTGVEVTVAAERPRSGVPVSPIPTPSRPVVVASDARLTPSAPSAASRDSASAAQLAPSTAATASPPRPARASTRPYPGTPPSSAEPSGLTELDLVEAIASPGPRPMAAPGALPASDFRPLAPSGSVPGTVRAAGAPAQASDESLNLDRRVSLMHARFDLLSQRIDRLMDDIGAQPEPPRSGFTPPSVAETAGRLARTGLDPDLAEGIASAALAVAAANGVPDEAAFLTLLAGALAEVPPRPPAPSQGRPRVIVLVGPTGNGKTTTAVKIAARAHFGEGARVVLVAADAYRVGAAAQLSEYAELVGVPLLAAPDPSALARALEECADADLVLVDTAGLAPHDSDRMWALRRLVNAVPREPEVLLVMSAATRRRDLSEAITRFSSIAPPCLALTKLDETWIYGEPLMESAASGCPIAWLGTGQAIPDDLEPATPHRLADLVVGAAWSGGKETR